MYDKEIEKEDNESYPMITPSEVIEYIYCPRFIYFMNCLNIPQHEENRYKVIKGRNIHELRETRNVQYLRNTIGVLNKEISVYLASRKLSIRGKVDEVLHLSDDTLAPLDYKYAEYREVTFRTHRIQSAIYAMLIEENYQKDVLKGYICYLRGGNKLKEIIYDEKDYFCAKNIISDIFEIVYKGYFPKKTKYRNKCYDCCYRNIC